MIDKNELIFGTRAVIEAIEAGKDIDKIVAEYQGKGYGDFKKDVAEAVVEEIRPIRARYDELSNDKQYLVDICEKGAIEASKIAGRTLSKVYKKVGFVQ